MHIGNFLQTAPPVSTGTPTETSSTPRTPEAADRRLCWTEDKCLQAFIERGDDGGIAAWYNYSADGERNIKFTSPRLNMHQNASLFNNPPLFIPTLYASSLITLTHKGYTKHYFEGERRICSAVGGGFSLVEWDTTAGFSSKMERTECHALLQQLEEGVSSAMRCVDVETSYVDAEGIMRMLQEQHQKMHDDPDVVFFYHLDHLGGTSYLTDKGGQVAQTLAYLPYGENWVDVTAFQYDTSQVGFYQFNGKERDPETGFLYYGARYYWPELWTGWLSVDPMADKYPSISPYAYCAWNPVKLVDHDGLDTIISFACRTPDAEQNRKNQRLGECIRNIGDSPHVLAIAMHGSSKEMQTSTGNGEVTKPLTAKQMADRITNMTDGSSLYVDNLEKGKSTIIILYSCNTGQGEDCFGQQLSKELESSVVIAPEGVVWAGINKNGQTTIDNAKNIGTAKNPKKGSRQNWNIYVNGEKVSSFRGAPQAWINRQGGINKVLEKIQNHNE